MQKVSAGLLMYQRKKSFVEFFLVHPGGPFWKDKDLGAWTIPKGEVGKGEDLLECAKREFEEETGIKSFGEFISLGEIRQKAGKIVHCWAFENDKNFWKGFLMKQNFIEIEWPPRSGKKIKIPEVDKAGFFDFETASRKINSAQKEFLDRLQENLY